MEYAKCLARLQRLCSRAEYCSADIYRKALKDLEGDAGDASRVVASLKEDRYVDDARFAAAFAREKASLQGWGPVKIRFQLRGKGISEADIALPWPKWSRKKPPANWKNCSLPRRAPWRATPKLS